MTTGDQGPSGPTVKIGNQPVKTAEGFNITPTGSTGDYLTRIIELLESIEEKLDNI